MNRKEWLKKLQMELYRMPRNEIDDAVAYYSEYFEEAGPEREEEIIRELGDPSKVAAQIKADYAVRQLDDMEREEARGERRRFWNRKGREGGYGEQFAGQFRNDYTAGSESWQEHVGNAGPGQQDGWQNAGGQNYQNAGGQGGAYQNAYQNRQDGYRDGYNNGYNDARQGTGRSRGRVGMIIAAIIGGILAAPIALPVAIVLICLAIGGIVVVGAVIVGLIALAIGGIIGGIGLLVSAFFTAGTTVAGMMVIIGAGLALAGFSILLGFLVIKVAAALTRAIARGISNRRARKQMAGGYNPGAYQSEGGYQNYSAQQDGFTQAAEADGFAQTTEADGFAQTAEADGFTQAGSADGWTEAPKEAADTQEMPEAPANDTAEAPADSEPAAPESKTEVPGQGDSSNTDGEVNEDAR